MGVGALVRVFVWARTIAPYGIFLFFRTWYLNGNFDHFSHFPFYFSDYLSTLHISIFQKWEIHWYKFGGIYGGEFIFSSLWFLDLLSICVNPTSNTHFLYYNHHHKCHNTIFCTVFPAQFLNKRKYKENQSRHCFDFCIFLQILIIATLVTT